MKKYAILIIKCGASGDVVRTTSFLQGLRERYGDCSISWVTAPYNLDLIKYNDLIDEKIVFHENLKNQLRSMYDLIISLDDEEAQCELASAVKKKRIIGSYVANDGLLTYTEDTEPWMGMGMLRRAAAGGKKVADQLKKENKKTYQEILAGILGIENHEPMITYGSKEKEFAQVFSQMHALSNEDIIIGLNTGAGNRWEYKKINEEKTAELATVLSKQRKTKIVLFGGPEECERNQKIMELTHHQLIDAGCNNSLLNLVALLDLCTVIITSDSLALHVAIALKKKVVAFFGPTPAAEIEMYGRGIKIEGHVPCLVCYLPTCSVRPTCMDTIMVREILSAVNQVLSLERKEKRRSIGN